MIHPELLPPLPVSLEDAHREIRYLQNQVYFARSQLAKSIEEREKDRRAARGNIQALREENKELREKIKENE
jgi:hypothetical protein